jgi:hypothetical protein
VLVGIDESAGVVCVPSAAPLHALDIGCADDAFELEFGTIDTRSDETESAANVSSDDVVASKKRPALTRASSSFSAVVCDRMCLDLFR